MTGRYNKHEARRRCFIFAEADILTESKTKPFVFKIIDPRSALGQELSSTGKSHSLLLSRTEVDGCLQHGTLVSPESQQPLNDLLLWKFGAFVHCGAEQPAAFVLTNASVRVLFTHNNRKEASRSFALGAIRELVRVSYGGAFCALEVSCVDGASFLFRFESEDAQQEVSRKLVRMSSLG